MFTTMFWAFTAATVFVCFFAVQSSADNCGTYSANMDQNFYPDHRLTSHVVSTSSVTRPLECYLKCLKNCLCVSFNVCNAGKKCELNSERKDSNISIYEQTDECDYYEYGYNKQKTSGSCIDNCQYFPTQPCLNGGTSQASCMKNGKRFQCNCRDGFKGSRCEMKPRSCADYAKSTNRAHGPRLIYAPDNSTYSVFCHFNSSTKTLTLTMSYRRNKANIYHSQPLLKDFPVSEDSPNLDDYRLSRARMIGLRDVSTHWVISCNYPTRGLSPRDYLRVKIANADPLTYDSQGDCIQVEYVNIKGKSCNNCKLGVAQGNIMFHASVLQGSDCGGWLGYDSATCDSQKARYFGSYLCSDKSFECTNKGPSTTQLWFETGN